MFECDLCYYEDAINEMNVCARCGKDFCGDCGDWVPNENSRDEDIGDWLCNHCQGYEI